MAKCPICFTDLNAGVSGWTDDPLKTPLHFIPSLRGNTPVRVKHITELQSRINGYESDAGIPLTTWTPTQGIRTKHINELREAIEGLIGYSGAGNELRDYLSADENGDPQPPYITDWLDGHRLTSKQPVRGMHIEQLRKKPVVPWYEPFDVTVLAVYNPNIAAVFFTGNKGTWMATRDAVTLEPGGIIRLMESVDDGSTPPDPVSAKLHCRAETVITVGVSPATLHCYWTMASVNKKVRETTKITFDLELDEDTNPMLTGHARGVYFRVLDESGYYLYYYYGVIGLYSGPFPPGTSIGLSLAEITAFDRNYYDDFFGLFGFYPTKITNIVFANASRSAGAIGTTHYIETYWDNIKIT